jgi:hypothetical protein
VAPLTPALSESAKTLIGMPIGEIQREVKDRQCFRLMKSIAVMLLRQSFVPKGRHNLWLLTIDLNSRRNV